MALKVENLAEVPDATVNAAFDYATTLAKEQQTNIDTKRGVIGDIVLRLDAVLSASHEINAERLRLSQSINAIAADPELSDDDLVDNVASTYRLTRTVASAASGELTIILSELTAVTIANGATFVANGNNYTADSAFAARTAAANVVLDTDRLITAVGTSEFVFTIDVTAVETGAEGTVPKDTKFVPLTPPTSFVRAYAATDFAGALDLESNTALLEKLQEGLAARAWSNRVTIPAMVRQSLPADNVLIDADFANILHFSIVGNGDAEMLRDQHWIFPVSGGGRSDMYVRSRALPQSTSVTKTATLIDKTAAGGIWQFSIGRAEAPGFYEVRNIVIANAAVTTGFEITEDIRANDLTDPDSDVYIPDVESALEGIYSRYQAATIRFLDTATVTSGLTVGTSTASYDATIIAMPLIEELQEFLGDRSTVSPAGDILVKAAIPCFLSLSFNLERRRTTTVIDTASIKNALATYVNNIGFAGKLYSSALARIIDESLPDNVDAGPVDMFGRIRRPDGVEQFIRDDDILTIPDQTASFTSGRTVVFILDAANVAISETAVDVPEV